MPTILITGATDGLGRRVAADLADAGWTVLVHGRSRERADGLELVVGIGIDPRSEIAEGARATERLIAAPELAGVTDRYFNGLREGQVDPQTHDPEARERLWELSERLVA